MVKSMWELFRFQLNAERLDHVLFVVAFVGNSVFLTMCFSEVWWVILFKDTLCLVCAFVRSLDWRLTKQ